jgi:hypothetical protein
MRTLKSLIPLAGLALGLLPATSTAQTFRVTGRELTGETTTIDADGSVRTVVQAGLDGLLYDVETSERVLAHSLLTMTVSVNGDVLNGASVTYRQSGRSGFVVTIQIDPCWFEYVNDRGATAGEFGADVIGKIEAQSPPGALNAHVEAWLIQRLAQLAARTAEPSIRSGLTLVPPRR